MPNEMKAEEAAKGLESYAGGFVSAKAQKTLLLAASILRRVASGELAEVKHAHWKQVHWKGWDGDPDEGTHPECSNCGEMPLLNGCEDYEESPCCPYCGAIMDESDMRQTQDGKEDSHE